MKSINKQIADKCIHFTGLMNKQCNAGIMYEIVKLPNQRPYKIPCLKNNLMSGGVCNSMQFPDKEEVNKQVQGIKEMGLKMMSAYKLVKEHIEKTGKKYGKIECPDCGGNLHYTSASCNGHIWAKCKCGLGWME